MTKIMGVLNVTPDSFSDGGVYDSVEKAVMRGLELAQQGADILDIGGESTRPGAEIVSLEEELSRVIPVIKELCQKLTIPISIDTMKPEVALAALKVGASLINDVSGFRHPQMIEVAARHDVEICCMHMQGDPKIMQKRPHYEGGVIDSLIEWMKNSEERLLKGGIKQERIIFDPGIGFGKTVAHNLEILQNLPRLRGLGYPLLIGASKKSFMSKILNKPPAKLGPATIAVHSAAVMQGIDIIRVHDVAEHRGAVDLLELLKER